MREEIVELVNNLIDQRLSSLSEISHIPVDKLKVASDVKWSSFPSASALFGSDQVVGLQSGNNVKATMSQISTFTNSGVTLQTTYNNSSPPSFNVSSSGYLIKDPSNNLLFEITTADGINFSSALYAQNSISLGNITNGGFSQFNGNSIINYVPIDEGVNNPNFTFTAQSIIPSNRFSTAGSYNFGFSDESSSPSGFFKLNLIDGGTTNNIIFASGTASGNLPIVGLHSQLVVSLGTGGTTNQHAAFQVNSSQYGFLPPVLNSSQETTYTSTLGSGDAGMEWFNPTTGTENYWDGSKLQQILTIQNLNAGSNVTLDKSIPGQVTINASGGGTAPSAAFASWAIQGNPITTPIGSANSFVPIAVPPDGSNFYNINSSDFTNQISSVSGFYTVISTYTGATTQYFMVDANIGLLNKSTGTQTYKANISILKSGGTLINTPAQMYIDFPDSATIQNWAEPLTGIVQLSTGDSVLVQIANPSTPSSFLGNYINFKVANIPGSIPNTNGLPQGSNNWFLTQNGGTTYQNLNGTAVVGDLAQFNSTGGQLIDSGISSTNVILSTGSYSDPSWITHLNGSKLTGTVTPNSSAGGDLSGTYPNPTVSHVNGVPFISTSVTDGQINIGSTSSGNMQAANITGTANQVNVTNGSNSITLSLPQSIATSSSPIFNGLNVTDLTASSLVATDSSKNLTSSVSGLSPTFTGLNLSGLSPYSVIFTDSSNNITTDSSSFGYGNSGGPVLALNTSSGNSSFVVATTDPAGISYMTMIRGTVSGKTHIEFETNSGGDQWLIGMPLTGTHNFALYDGVAGITPISITQGTGIVNLYSLTASQAVVTDSSKNLTSLAYTSSNTTNTLVERDSSGNFSAGTITATLSGNSSTSTTATNANNIATNSTTSNSTYYLGFFPANSSSNQVPQVTSGLTVNPSTDTLSVSALNIGTSSNTSLLTVVGAGGTTYPASSLAYFSSASTPPAGNIYEITINKSGTESLLLGINKSTATGGVPPSSTFISTYTPTGQISIGRGNGAGLPNNADLQIDSSGNVIVNNGSFQLTTAGKTIQIATGTNACRGTATMSTGSSSVSTTAATTGNMIIITGPNANSYGYTITNGSGFSITSSNGSDSSTVQWIMFK